MLRWLGAGLVWILAGLVGLVGALLCVTIILLPLGIPALMLAKRLFSLAARLVLPRVVTKPTSVVKEPAGKARATGAQGRGTSRRGRRLGSRHRQGSGQEGPQAGPQGPQGPGEEDRPAQAARVHLTASAGQASAAAPGSVGDSGVPELSRDRPRRGQQRAHSCRVRRRLQHRRRGHQGDRRHHPSGRLEHRRGDGRRPAHDGVTAGVAVAEHALDLGLDPLPRFRRHPTQRVVDGRPVGLVGEEHDALRCLG